MMKIQSIYYQQHNNSPINDKFKNKNHQFKVNFNLKGIKNHESDIGMFIEEEETRKRTFGGKNIF